MSVSVLFSIFILRYTCPDERLDPCYFYMNIDVSIVSSLQVFSNAGSRLRLIRQLEINEEHGCCLWAELENIRQNWSCSIH